MLISFPVAPVGRVFSLDSKEIIVNLLAVISVHWNGKV